MTRKVYALFVGIDEYVAPVRLLKGCVNDITRMRTLFAERIKGGQDEFLPLTLANSEATRANVIAGFREHLGQAGPDDVALFYYSGHGSQEKAPPEFWHLEPDRLNETLVLYDSRRLVGRDLADKELSYLISEVAKNGAHVTVILDSCHSGSGTRDALDDLEAGVAVRLQATDRRTRPISSYILSQEEADALYIDPAGQARDEKWIALPQGKHVLLAACGDHETAKETNIAGERRGVFSYYLQDTLQNTTGSLTYRNLFKRVQALVPNKVRQQTPLIEATEASLLEQPFLGGAVPERPPFFTLSYEALSDEDGRWLIDGGAVHGIAAPSGGEMTLLAIFAKDTPLENLASLASSLGQSRVESVQAAHSVVSVATRDGRPLAVDTYQAVVVAQPLPPLVVAFEGEETALQLVRDKLAVAGTGRKPSLLLREGALEEAEYRLCAERIKTESGERQRYRIRRKADAYPLAVDTEGFQPDRAAVVVTRLEHIARWQKIAELTNLASNIPQDAVRMDFFHVNDEGEWEIFAPDQQMRFAYKAPYGAQDRPIFRVKLTNTTDQTYYCMLLAMAQDYSIFVDLLPKGIVMLEPNGEAWGMIKSRGHLTPDIPVTIPAKLYEQNITQLKDIMKLIVSTDEADAALLRMDALPLTVVTTRKAGLIGQMSTLNRLMERVHSRHIGDPDEEEAYSDWRTSEVSSVIERPLPPQNVATTGEATMLAPGVTLQGHSQLQAQVKLASLESASRDAGTLLVPAIFRDHPEIYQPLEFTPSRGGQPGLALLEFECVVNPQEVTTDNPLILTLNETFGLDELILPYAFDGERFLPLGQAQIFPGQARITIEYLPLARSEGTAEDECSTFASIKIMFRRIAAGTLEEIAGILADKCVLEAEFGSKSLRLGCRSKAMLRATKLAIFSC